MNSTEMKLAAQMLRSYSERLSCDGCDEICLKKTPENMAIAEAVEKANDPDDPLDVCVSRGKIIVGGSMLADYLADQLDNPSTGGGE